MTSASESPLGLYGHDPIDISLQALSYIHPPQGVNATTGGIVACIVQFLLDDCLTASLIDHRAGYVAAASEAYIFELKLRKPVVSNAGGSAEQASILEALFGKNAQPGSAVLLNDLGQKPAMGRTWDAINTSVEKELSRKGYLILNSPLLMRTGIALAALFGAAMLWSAFGQHTTTAMLSSVITAFVGSGSILLLFSKLHPYRSRKHRSRLSQVDAYLLYTADWHATHTHADTPHKKLGHEIREATLGQLVAIGGEKPTIAHLAHTYTAWPPWIKDAHRTYSSQAFAETANALIANLRSVCDHSDTLDDTADIHSTLAATMGS